MIVETSAAIAILRDEPEAAQFSIVLGRARAPKMSAASYLECGIVIDAQRDPVASAQLDALIGVAGIIVEPVTPAQAKIARQAYRDFGKGSDHPAQLNFGDCLAYALAKDKAEPLLFKGADFAQTDLASAT